MTTFKIFFILCLMLPFSLVSSEETAISPVEMPIPEEETASFSIDFSEEEPHQILQTTENLEVTEVRAELADGTVETVAYGSAPDFSSELTYLSAGNGWQAANAMNAKRFLFTVRATGPYTVLEITGLGFTIQRPVGSGNTSSELTVRETSIVSGELPIGDPVLLQGPIFGTGSARDVTIAIKVWDEEIDEGVVRIARIGGSAQITRVPVEADSTLDATNHHAYSANTGWINLRPDAEHGVVAGEYFLSGHAWSGNVGWIHLGAGTPVNGWRYGNESADDFGVNIGDFGNLSGYAYGANIGWINFGWADASDPNRPRIDLQTGAFHGYAYGANIGWIFLGDGTLLATDTMDLLDSEGDGMADAWKYRYFGSLDGAGENTDHTNDGFTDLEHYLAGTDPTVPFRPLEIIHFDMVRNENAQSAHFEFTTTPRRLYRIEYTDDLLNPDWQLAGEVVTPDPGGVTERHLDIPTSVEAEVYRIRAIRPLDL